MLLVRFSKRAMNAIRDCIVARTELDVSSGKPLGSLPRFARHDKLAGRKIISVKSITMWSLIQRRAEEASVDPARINEHDFRNYIVMRIQMAEGDIQDQTGIG